MAGKPILVYSELRWAERLVAALLGKRAVGFHALAEAMDERTIACFPVAAHCQAQEDNVRLLADLEAEGLAPYIGRLAAAHQCDGERFLRLARQRFLFGLGYRVMRVRQALSVPDLAMGPVALATDLPAAVARALMRQAGHASDHRAASALLRSASWATRTAHRIGRHAWRIARLAGLATLPRRPRARSPAYVAWLNAIPSEVASASAERVSLPAFLAEGVARAGCGPVEVVVHGAAPAAADRVRFIHRAHHPALRYRPRTGEIARAVAAQLAALMCDLWRSADWRHGEVAAPILLELPALVAWFRADPPAAVLYTNHTIGGESAAPLVAGRYGVRTMMVLYSTNYRYHVPAVAAGRAAPTVLFPESRHVAADMVAMWSDEMAALYRGAGYPAERLPVIGPVHFAHQGTVRAGARFGAARGPANGLVRVGVFDVSTLRPARLFAIGYGQTMYFRGFADRFFADLVAACRAAYGTDFVVVRKLKRALGPDHVPDVELDRLLQPAQRRAVDPDANLWRVLEDVDVVLCMPFTSVALMADHMGVPAAFFDPLGISVPSEAAGSLPHLIGRAALESWLRAPRAPAAAPESACAAANVIRVAMQGAGSVPAPARCAAA